MDERLRVKKSGLVDSFDVYFSKSVAKLENEREREREGEGEDERESKTYQRRQINVNEEEIYSTFAPQRKYSDSFFTFGCRHWCG